MNQTYLKSLNYCNFYKFKEISFQTKTSVSLTVMGYIFAVLGGILGLALGYSLWASKKTLPNGKKVWSYVESDRRNGK